MYMMQELCAKTSLCDHLASCLSKKSRILKNMYVYQRFSNVLTMHFLKYTQAQRTQNYLLNVEFFDKPLFNYNISISNDFSVRASGCLLSIIRILALQTLFTYSFIPFSPGGGLREKGRGPIMVSPPM